MFIRFELFVSDLSRSVKFYERVLNFARKGEQGTHSGYIAVVNGDVHLGLAAFDLLPRGHHFRQVPVDRYGVGVEIVLEVENLEQYEQRARRTGAISEPLQRRPWGLSDFRVVDPDGYYIRVTQQSSDPPPVTRV